MSQPANFILPTGEKFDSSNWAEWKESIISAAKSHGVLGYLEGTILRPTTPSSSTDPSIIPIPATPLSTGDLGDPVKMNGSNEMHMHKD
jgi:hypothetical protein